MRLSNDDSIDNIFSDLLFNVLTAIIVVLFLAILLINPISDDGNVKKDAQFIIDMTWPTNIDCDIDMWVQGPDRQTVSFTKKSNEYMHIERDDLGFTSDTIKLPDGEEITVKENREIWTLRGKFDGRYVVNVHAYNCRTAKGLLGLGDPINVPVTIKVIRINPKYVMEAQREVLLTKMWQEETAVIFKLSRKTKSFKRLTTEKIPLVTSQRAGQVGGF